MRKTSVQKETLYVRRSTRKKPLLKSSSFSLLYTLNHERGTTTSTRFRNRREREGERAMKEEKSQKKSNVHEHYMLFREHNHVRDVLFPLEKEKKRKNEAKILSLWSCISYSTHLLPYLFCSSASFQNISFSSLIHIRVNIFNLFLILILIITSTRQRI